jgi:hypothetical protein
MDNPVKIEETPFSSVWIGFVVNVCFLCGVEALFSFFSSSHLGHISLLGCVGLSQRTNERSTVEIGLDKISSHVQPIYCLRKWKCDWTYYWLSPKQEVGLYSRSIANRIQYPNFVVEKFIFKQHWFVFIEDIYFIKVGFISKLCCAFLFHKLWRSNQTERFASLFFPWLCHSCNEKGLSIQPRSFNSLRECVFSIFCRVDRGACVFVCSSKLRSVVCELMQNSLIDSEIINEGMKSLNTKEDHNPQFRPTNNYTDLNRPNLSLQYKKPEPGFTSTRTKVSEEEKFNLSPQSSKSTQSAQSESTRSKIFPLLASSYLNVI